MHNQPTMAQAAPPTALQRAIPNWLTASRVLMALIFFTVLAIWRWEDSPMAKVPGPGAIGWRVDWLLLGAAALFAVAVVTDALDGYLARLWKAESVFGRIMDPFADKILIVGAFVFLAGPDFWLHMPDKASLAGHGIQISGIYPWMVVVMLARELLVTSIRGTLESQGVTFASDWWGKGKMILQSVVVPAVLCIIALFPVTPQPDGTAPWGRWAIDVCVWVTLGVTVISGIPYVRRCLIILAQWAEHKRELRKAGE